ncbi:MAG: MarR family transcriptional regulator [Calditrichaeota bacterium]|nr:MAG: MarR family transcriptional regulator [Calditrichota bacterium]
MDIAQIKLAFIQDYGEGYQHFGFPKLMGRIVGLLLFEGKAMSLDEITTELNVSKGPVSQITNRLKEHKVIERVWVPGSRKDHYQAQSEIFGNAFYNRMQLQKQNLLLANKFHKLLERVPENEAPEFRKNISEMAEFYQLMMKHYKNFLDEWMHRHDK